MKKLCEKRGETLIETLSALLIAVLVMLFLSTAVVTASRINNSVQDIDSPLVYDESSDGSQLKVTIKGDDISENVTVREYKDASGRYRYYTKE